MIYLIFNSELEAQSAINLIDDKIKTLISSVLPDAVDEYGIIARNAATGERVSTNARTTTWANPIETIDGKWVIPKFIPEIHTPPEYHPLFLNFYNGLDIPEHIESNTHD